MDLQTLRHSASHVMAQAVKELWPDVKLGIGPSIEDGFYYDFDKAPNAQGEKQLFSLEDLAKIEAKMNEIIYKNEPFLRLELSKAEARELLDKRQEAYKLELLQEILDEK